MAIYIVLIFYIVLANLLIGNKTDRARKRFCICAFLALFLLQALRSYTVGVDLQAYRITFFNIDGLSFIKSLQYGNSVRMEPALVGIMWIINKLCGSWQVFIVVISLFINAVVCGFAYRNSKNPVIFILIYIGLGLFVFSFSGLRQMCAIAFTMVAYDAMLRKKFISFILSIALACICHISALIMIVMILFYKKRFTFKWFVAFSILMVAIMLFAQQIAKLIVPVIFPRYVNYLNKEYTFGFLGLFLVMTFWLLYAMNYYHKKVKKNNLALFMVAIGACCQSFGNVTTITSRLTFFFIPYFALAFSNSIHSESSVFSSQEKRNLIVLYCIFILLALFLPNILEGYLNVTPYQFFWQNQT
ncbi:MAG: EpsG family protein [Clostridia bacterium]|nr:EpsG family protein [Clostridia bacterium]